MKMSNENLSMPAISGTPYRVFPPTIPTIDSRARTSVFALINFLEEFLGMEPELRIHVGTAQKVQGAARRRDIFLEQLRLGERKQVGEVLRFELDSALQMLFGRGRVLLLNQIEDAD